MENITTGHWIFAAIFAVAFVFFLIWSYRKDSKTHDKFGIGGSRVLLGILMVLILIFIFKRVFF
ncbi:hypothetical protein F8C67_01295 [Phaeocystidibacter luteus]|uniref:Uncharacterized protein n=1 Tax=Phaeocystidibacter luteus TaxID=911197 RepID=A0A6N6RLE8_9FLAO|nr:hypothetical protein F8C67_01295 [Phaeocystidibacter luteus]